MNNFIRTSDCVSYYSINGKELAVDTEDAVRFFGVTILIGTNGYARFSVKHKNIVVSEYLHRAIMNPSDSQEVDHINGNKLDCRKSNMRVCTHAENTRNTARRSDNSSGAVGISWDKKRLLWVAALAVDGKRLHVGRYADKDAAISARKSAEKKHHKEFSQHLCRP